MMRYSWISKVYPLLLLINIISLPVFGENVDTLDSVMSSASIDYMITPDKRKVRYAHWKANENRKNITIVILQGRASFIEKHSEFVQDLTKLGYDVFTFDWAGQGLSTRLTQHHHKAHIDSYDTFLKDTDQFLQTLVKTNSSQPIILFGSSMGGHLALRYMADYPHQVSGAILESPMLNVPTKPFPEWLARLLVYGGAYLGFEEAYAPGYGDFDPSKDIFENSNNTSDKTRFLRQHQYTLLYPTHVVGGPTYGWVKATFDSIDKMGKPNYLNKIIEPILLLNAGGDTTVLNIDDSKTCEKLKKCNLINYKSSKHHIIMEKDEIRNQFWKDFNAFMQNFSHLSLQ